MNKCSVCGSPNAKQCGFLANEVCTTYVCELHQHKHPSENLNDFKVGDKAIWIFDPGGRDSEKYRKLITVEIIEVKEKVYIIEFDGKTKKIHKSSKFLRPLS